MSPSTYQSEPVPASLAEDTMITLQVGERRFVTTPVTLQESGFFSTLLSGRWDNVQADGSYFIDADAHIFEHILRYLRRGVLPVFYNNIKDHDHTLYLALLEEAKYFQILRLEQWIENKRYFEAVNITYSAAELDGANTIHEATRTDTEIEHHPCWVTERVYICPRGINRHRGDLDACGKICRKAQGDDEEKFVDDQVLKVVQIRKRTVFNWDICREGR